MDKPTAEVVKRAATSAGLILSDDEINRLMQDQEVPLSANHLDAANKKCSGLKIISIGRNCGLYANLWPPGLRLCCDI
jgi:hypothetical protein